ncbi:4-hydroxy-tetrahydrodipicolinate synthase [Cohnella cellulosilytica]|uniref:4-hydroxy-tetrahydrodipicolinate synthase n=1 Tax=Cohnella cellulosilytica TaxID=986710 RepID=A0ABW2FGF2_9BACL
MLSAADLKGIYVAVVTPFLSNGELDLASYERYVGHLMELDIDGLVVAGTTGESPTIAWEEVEALVRATRNARGARSVPIVVGTGTNSTADTVRRTEMAGRIGADAALVVTPYYSRPSEAGILEHYRRASRTGVPVIAYEIPARTGVRLSAGTMRTILELEGVIGLKDSSGSTQLLRELGGSIAKPVLCGDDSLLFEMLEQGASGGISASASVRTKDFIEVCRQFAAGNDPAARETFEGLRSLIEDLFREPNPSPLKWLLARQNLLADDTVRLPLSPITPGLQAKLSRYVEE